MKLGRCFSYSALDTRLADSDKKRTCMQCFSHSILQKNTLNVFQNFGSYITSDTKPFLISI